MIAQHSQKVRPLSQCAKGLLAHQLNNRTRKSTFPSFASSESSSHTINAIASTTICATTVELCATSYQLVRNINLKRMTLLCSTSYMKTLSECMQMILDDTRSALVDIFGLKLITVCHSSTDYTQSIRATPLEAVEVCRCRPTYVSH